MHTRSQKVAAGAGFECSTIRLGDKGLFYLSRTICRLFSKIHTAHWPERESKAECMCIFEPSSLFAPTLDNARERRRSCKCHYARRHTLTD
jgi:hypothetical protein